MPPVRFVALLFFLPAFYAMIKRYGTIPLRLLVAAVFFSLWGPLFAGEVTVTVRGADLDIPLEGAVIHSWDGEEYLCDEDGR